jgi:hypothetical protein
MVEQTVGSAGSQCEHKTGAMEKTLRRTLDRQTREQAFVSNMAFRYNPSFPMSYQSLKLKIAPGHNVF